MTPPKSLPPEVVAQFRFTVIAPLVTRRLAYGEQQALVAQQSAQMWQTPDGQERQIHPRTILRWTAAYRRGGLSALEPDPPPSRLRRISPAVLDRAVALRTEDPHRSAHTIIQLLEWNGDIAPGSLAHSTLTYHLRQRKAASYQASPPAETFRRRQAPRAMAEWQGDTQRTLTLPDPRNPERQRPVYLIAFIDDATRYVVGSRFFFDENRPRLEEVLKWAVVRHGIPEIIHVDNGSIYASHYLTRVCAELGLDLRRSTVRRPQGKGKIERLFRRVDQQLTHELQALVADGTLQTLTDLNAYWEAWLAQGYHQQVHRSLGVTPQAAWEQSRAESAAFIRMRPVDEIQRIFLWQDTRKVDKTGIIQLAGNRYEVASLLAGKRVECRYDPYQLDRIFIRYQGESYGEAQPLMLAHHRHREAPVEDHPFTAPRTGVNLAQLARERQEAERAHATARLRYADRTPASLPEKESNHES